MLAILILFRNHYRQLEGSFILFTFKSPFNDIGLWKIYFILMMAQYDFELLMFLRRLHFHTVKVVIFRQCCQVWRLLFACTTVCYLKLVIVFINRIPQMWLFLYITFRQIWILLSFMSGEKRILLSFITMRSNLYLFHCDIVYFQIVPFSVFLNVLNYSGCFAYWNPNIAQRIVICA